MPRFQRCCPFLKCLMTLKNRSRLPKILQNLTIGLMHIWCKFCSSISIYNHNNEFNVFLMPMMLVPLYTTSGATMTPHVIDFCLYNVPVMIYGYMYTNKDVMTITKKSFPEMHSLCDLEKVGQGHPYFAISIFHIWYTLVVHLVSIALFFLNILNLMCFQHISVHIFLNTVGGANIFRHVFVFLLARHSYQVSWWFMKNSSKNSILKIFTFWSIYYIIL